MLTDGQSWPGEVVFFGDADCLRFVPRALLLHTNMPPLLRNVFVPLANLKRIVPGISYVVS